MLQWVDLLLEFQATVDRFMAVRILVYVGLLCQDLIRDNKLTPDGRLPPVLVEERAYSESELAPMRNLVAALFRLENSRGPEDIIRVLEGGENHVGRTRQRLEETMAGRGAERG
jgi:hypothetical protein